MPDFDPYHKWLGIPPEDQPPHHYRLLGLKEFESDPDVIDAAADRQMSYLQTCATGEHIDESQQLLNRVSQARVCLLNPKKKAAYDQKLKAALAKRDRKRKQRTSPEAAPAPAPMPVAEPVAPPPIVVATEESSSSKVRRPAKRSKRGMLLAWAGGIVTIVAAVWIWKGRGDDTATGPADASDPTTIAETEQQPPKNTANDANANARQPNRAQLGGFEPAQPRLVCQLLAAKAKTLGLTEEAVRFTAPEGSGRSGAIGFYLPPRKGESHAASEWRLGYHRFGNARGIQLVHPFQDGHVMVTVYSKGAVVFAGGSWQSIGGFVARKDVTLTPPEPSPEVFPIEGSRLRTIVSRLERDGRYSLRIDGQLVGTATITAAEPLEVSDGFDAAGLPMKWPAGSAGVIVGPTDTDFNRAEELHFAAGETLAPFESPNFDTIPWAAGTPVDLLGRIDVERDRIYGAWQFDKGALVSPQGLRYSRIHLPGDPTDEYDLSFTAAPTDTAMHVIVGLVLPGGKRCSVVLYPFQKVVGIDWLDQKDYLSNETTRRNTPFSKEMQVHCAVRRESVQVKLNGNQVIDWKIDAERLGELHYVWQPRDRNRLLIGTNDQYRFSNIELTPVGVGPAAVSQRLQTAVDLLSVVNVERDTIEGEWRLDGGALLTEQLAKNGIHLPAPLPEEYDVTVHATPLTDPAGAVFVGLPLPNEHRTVFAYVPDRQTTGLAWLDGKPAYGNESTKRGITFKPSSQNVLQVQVRRNGIRATLNGEEVLNWSGDFTRLGQHPALQFKHNDQLFLGAYDRYRITKLELTPVPTVPTVPSRPIDLLAMIDLERDRVEGTWTRTAEGLVFEGQRSRVQIPCSVPAEYRLTAVVEHLRVSPPNFTLGLVAGGQQFRVSFDIAGRWSSLIGLDGKMDATNATTFTGRVFETGKSSTVVCTVRRDGLQVAVDGKELIRWDGPYERLSNDPLWAVPNENALYVGAGTSSFQITKLELTPLTAGLPVVDTTPTYLAEMTPTAMKVHHGLEGPQQIKISVNGTPSPRGFWMSVAGKDSPSHAVYDLKRQYLRFRGAVAINDSVPTAAESPITFRIHADEKLLWQSQPLQKKSESQNFDVDVSNVEQLKLETVSDSSRWAHSVWLEPRLFKQAPEPSTVLAADAQSPQANARYASPTYEPDEAHLPAALVDAIKRYNEAAIELDAKFADRLSETEEKPLRLLRDEAEAARKAGNDSSALLIEEALSVMAGKAGRPLTVVAGERDLSATSRSAMTGYYGSLQKLDEDYRSGLAAIESRLLTSLDRQMSAAQRMSDPALVSALRTLSQSIQGAPRKPLTPLRFDRRRFGNGLLILEYAKHESQLPNPREFVPEYKLGPPVAMRLDRFDEKGDWRFDPDHNAVAKGYLKIDVPGDYAFTTYGHHSGGSFLIVHGTVIDQSKTENGRRATVVSLDTGMVPFESIGRIGNGGVRIFWSTPLQQGLRVIPPDVVHHDKILVRDLQGSAR